MTARRTLVAVAGTLLVLAGVLGACSNKMTLRRAAEGTWSCVPPKSSGAVKLIVGVKGGGAFTVTYPRPNGQSQTITGGWNLSGEEVNLTFTGAASVVAPILVKGVKEDATSLDLKGTGSGVGANVPSSKIVVARKGWSQVTFRNAAKGSITYTCSKQ